MQNVKLPPEMSQPIGMYISRYLKDQRLITIRPQMFYKIGGRRLFLRPGLLIGLLGITAWLLLAPNPLPFGISVQREMGFVGHVGLFTMVTFACLATFPGTIGRATAVLLLAAICLEAAQVFAPTRDVDFTDLAMNCLGVLFGRVVFRGSATLRAVHSSRRRVKP